MIIKMHRKRMPLFPVFFWGGVMLLSYALAWHISSITLMLAAAAISLSFSFLKNSTKGRKGARHDSD